MTSKLQNQQFFGIFSSSIHHIRFDRTTKNINDRLEWWLMMNDERQPQLQQQRNQWKKKKIEFQFYCVFSNFTLLSYYYTPFVAPLHLFLCYPLLFLSIEFRLIYGSIRIFRSMWFIYYVYTIRHLLSMCLFFWFLLWIATLVAIFSFSFRELTPV